MDKIETETLKIESEKAIRVFGNFFEDKFKKTEDPTEALCCLLLNYQFNLQQPEWIHSWIYEGFKKYREGHGKVTLDEAFKFKVGKKNHLKNFDNKEVNSGIQRLYHEIFFISKIFNVSRDDAVEILYEVDPSGFGENLSLETLKKYSRNSRSIQFSEVFRGLFPIYAELYLHILNKYSVNTVIPLFKMRRKAKKIIIKYLEINNCERVGRGLEPFEINKETIKKYFSEITFSG